jgi:hypothetical protein
MTVINEGFSISHTIIHTTIGLDQQIEQSANERFLTFLVVH